MRVPRQFLRFEAIVRDFDGSGGRGPVFGEPRAIRCSIQPTFARVASNGRSTLIIDTLLIIRPEDGPVRPQSTVEAQGVVYQVIEAYPTPDPRRPSHWELRCSKSGSAP